MTLLNSANDFYESNSRAKYLSPSLVSFFKQSPLNQWISDAMMIGDAIEIGCGEYSIFEMRSELFGSRLSRALYACDISPVAIKRSPQNSDVDYFSHDIKKRLPKKYQLIIDAHCLHTLESFPELYFTLGLLYQNLENNGVLVGEVMMSHKNMSFESYYDYNENEKVLYRYGEPHRMIMSSYEWEDLFVSVGFKIQYFMCQSSIKFVPSIDRSEALASDPECLRFVLTKNR